MDGGEPPPADDPARLIFLDAGRTEDVEALALAAPGGRGRSGHSPCCWWPGGHAYRRSGRGR